MWCITSAVRAPADHPSRCRILLGCWGFLWCHDFPVMDSNVWKMSQIFYHFNNMNICVLFFLAMFMCVKFPRVCPGHGQSGYGVAVRMSSSPKVYHCTTQVHPNLCYINDFCERFSYLFCDGSSGNVFACTACNCNWISRLGNGFGRQT